MKLKLTRLDLSWSVSRGRDSYGYNICRLDDTTTGKRYKCNGGGYDMTGTVFGDWLEDVYQDRVLALAAGDKKFYGLRVNDGKAHLDGACGIDCMLDVARAIGLEVQRYHNKKGATTGWLICEPEGEPT